MPRTVEVEGVEYPVVENLGYQHSAGVYVRCVAVAKGIERMAVSWRASGPWRWWRPKDRVRPLVSRRREDDDVDLHNYGGP